MKIPQFLIALASLVQLVFLPSTARAVDSIPPAIITNLGTVQTSSSVVTLSWTAPGNDGEIGTAVSYDIRSSMTGPVTSDTWNTDTIVGAPPTPLPAGSAQAKAVTVTPGKRYWFGIKTYDGTFWSGASNCAANPIANIDQADVWLFGAGSWGSRERRLLSTFLQPDFLHRGGFEWVGTNMADRLYDGAMQSFTEVQMDGTTIGGGISANWWAPKYESLATGVNINEAGPPTTEEYNFLNQTTNSAKLQLIYKAKKAIDAGFWGVEYDEIFNNPQAATLMNDVRDYALNTYGRKVYMSTNGAYGGQDFNGTSTANNGSEAVDYYMRNYPYRLGNGQLPQYDSTENFDGTYNLISNLRQAHQNVWPKRFYYFVDFGGTALFAPHNYAQWPNFLKIGNAQILASGGFPGEFRSWNNAYSVFEENCFVIQANLFKFIRENSVLWHNLTFLSPATLSTTAANVRLSALGQTGRTIVHVVNGNFNNATQAMTSVSNFAVSVSVAAAPVSVWMTTPDKLAVSRKSNLSFTYSAGVATITVPQLDFHNVLLLEQTAAPYNPKYTATKVAFPFPSPATLSVGSTFRYVAMPTEGTLQAVDWQVNNVTGGNATVGTIDVNGNYTAPAAIPTGGTVTIKAISKEAVSALASINLSIVAAPAVPWTPSFAAEALDSIPTGWQVVDGSGDWEISSDAGTKVLHNANLAEGRREPGNVGGVMYDALVTAGGQTWQNYAFQVAVKPIKTPYTHFGFANSKPDSYVGLVFRFKDYRNYYEYRWCYDNYVRLYKIVNGYPSMVGSAQPGSMPGLNSYSTLKVDVSGTTFTAYKDGVVVRTDAETSITQGSVGFVTSLTENYFKDIAVTVAGGGGTPPPTGTNLALGKPVTISSFQGASALTDGSVGGNNKWWAGSVPQWAAVDLGATYSIDRWVVKHAAAGGEPTYCNTADFKLQKSSDGTTWIDVDPVVGNTANITDRTVTAFSARYVRLYVTKANAAYDDDIRIYEFEVYGAGTPPPSQVATPSFSPVAGTYTSSQSVTLASATSGAAIRYTTNGTTPTAASTLYSGAINLTATTTLKAVALKSGLTDSAVATGVFTIQVATPTFSPPGATYSSTQSVTLSTATSGASIRYTTDGSTPTATSTLYSAPISVAASMTIKAIGLKTGLNNSGVGSAAYVISATAANRALNKPATMSGDFGVSALTDGSISNGAKWWAGTVPQSATVDLGASFSLNRWVVKHANAAGEGPTYNTADFKLQKSPDGITWTDVDAVVGNSANITDRTVAPFTARYVRLYVTKANLAVDDDLRIYEFEVY